MNLCTFLFAHFLAEILLQEACTHLNLLSTLGQIGKKTTKRVGALKHLFPFLRGCCLQLPFLVPLH